MTARRTDSNGWYEAKGNPMTKVGVFPYLGSEIPGAPDPGRVYNVYRPAEELARETCLNSFKLIPFVDNHAMLGPSEQGLMDVSDKGAHGVTGEEIMFDGEYIRGNLKVWSEPIANLITNGKRELSAGYRCIYDWTAGIFNGVTYDAIQRDIQANHLALVQNGRMGPDVAVLDHYTFTIDSLEHVQMADENKGGGELAELKAAIDKFGPMLQEFEGIKEQLAGLTAAKAPAKEGEGEMSDEEKAAKAKADAGALDMCNKMDAMDAQVKDLQTKLAAAMDAAPKVKDVLAQVQTRDALVARLNPVIGVFDHALMDANEVAAYACDKLGLKPATGNEVVAVDAYLTGRGSAAPAAHVADAAPVEGSAVALYLSGKKE